MLLVLAIWHVLSLPGETDDDNKGGAVIADNSKTDPAKDPIPNTKSSTPGEKPTKEKVKDPGKEIVKDPKIGKEKRARTTRNGPIPPLISSCRRRSRRPKEKPGLKATSCPKIASPRPTIASAPWASTTCRSPGTPASSCADSSTRPRPCGPGCGVTRPKWNPASPTPPCPGFAATSLLDRGVQLTLAGNLPIIIPSLPLNESLVGNCTVMIFAHRSDVVAWPDRFDRPEGDRR